MAERDEGSIAEPFTAEERAVLSRYVTDVDGPVFALVNLPEVVKGALFARYSRSRKSLRRLLLDEFATDLPDVEAATGTGGDRAERLYRRVFDEYGDDSVAQLGGAHVAVEQASNLLTKVIEWGRLAAYLEQSTRYQAYDDKPGGRYRYHIPRELADTGHLSAYTTTMEAVFDEYAALLPPLRAWLAERFPRDAETSEAVHRNSINAKACDLLRGLLPAATISNVGIFASGQAYEQLLLRLRHHELAEARDVGDRLLGALREVIPAFLTRVDRPDRGEAWGRYQRDTREETRAVAESLLAGASPQEAGPEVRLVDWSPDAEAELVTGALYPHTHLSEPQLREQVAAMGTEERARVLRAYVGERGNRRHKPGRPLERIWYRFEICGDYGAFRDLQRHRLLTIDWQELSPLHGYAVPALIEDAGLSEAWHRTLERQAELWRQLHPELPRQAQYAIGFAYRLRYSIELNARAALHLIELRSAPQGHPDYRRIAQRMHTLIAEQAGHRAVADLMTFVDHGAADLERLEAERAAEARRAARG